MRTADQNYRTDLVEVVTIGFPFCAFKVVTGMRLLQEEKQVTGWLLVALGLIDAALNATNLMALIFVKRRAVPTCTFSLMANWVPASAATAKGSLQDVGNALDVLVSFTLVALMVGLGKIPLLPVELLQAWNVAVVLNVLGAGLSRFGASLKRVT